MPYQEKQSIVNIFSGLLISSIFAWIIYQRQANGLIDLTTDYRQWGIIYLIFIGVSIIARIIIYIIFHILNAIATREMDIPVTDERDKLIRLKATRNSYNAFFIGFAPLFLLLAVGMPVFWIFIGFAASGLIAEIVENVSQIYYYRKGV
ncbi:MAG: hypothetical protein A2X22_01450 [Bacteroidetes bacterium GWF2_49_14]|nr:MAG: hypothetical protein A2X22_01450 [Bacteroidetes bacterium GWF2_49_14]HBB93177.1 hypothetical protein [Bacteroidales bacterium]